MEFLKLEFKALIETKCKEFSGGIKVNFFELLHTHYGFEALQSWFFSQSGSDIDEYGLWKILNTISEKITETLSWEIFDTLSQDTTISFKEFCMIIFLFSAAETGQLRLMLYMHGKKLFQQLSGGEKQDICFERVKRIGRMLGMNERYLIQKGKEFSLNSAKSPLNFEQFQLYYFKIFAEIDYVEPVAEVPSGLIVANQGSISCSELPANPAIPANPLSSLVQLPSLPPINKPQKTGQTGPKKKSSCTGCKSKACVLL